MDMGHDNKKCKTCGIKYKDCEGCLKYNNIKDDLIPNKFWIAIKISEKQLIKT